MMTGTFDFDDFMSQTRMISKMGSLSGTYLLLLLLPPTHPLL